MTTPQALTYVREDGTTTCCNAFSTFMDDGLGGWVECCKACYGESYGPDFLGSVTTVVRAVKGGFAVFTGEAQVSAALPTETAANEQASRLRAANVQLAENIARDRGVSQ